MSGDEKRNWVTTVQSFGMSDDEADALFDRVAEAAHRLDEQVTVNQRLERGSDG